MKREDQTKKTNVPSGIPVAT